MDNSTLFDVKGKVVLITGGAKGIGRMISEGFVQNGATVYISSRDAKACEQACQELNALGKGKADFIAADLYKEDAAKNIAEELKRRAGKLDVLVNNSGSNWGESFDNYPAAAWDRVLNLNLKRVFQLTQAVTPLLEAASSSTSPARIINIGSIDGLRVPALETFAYSASKAGLHHMSRVLANHLGKRGITSNTIACGPFQSKMMKATLEKFKDDHDIVDAIANRDGRLIHIALHLPDVAFSICMTPSLGVCMTCALYRMLCRCLEGACKWKSADYKLVIDG